MNHDSNVQRLPKAFYLITFALLLISSAAISAYLMTQAQTRGAEAVQRSMPLAFLPMMAGSILVLRLCYQMWAAIQDGHARTTPAKAVGLLFVPLFNIYWAFVAFWGFSKDYNAYIKRHGFPLKRLPEGLFLAYLILAFTAWVPVIGVFAGLVGLVLAFVLVAKICDAVNALGLEQAAFAVA